MIGEILAIIRRVLDYLAPDNELLRLKKEEHALEEKMYRAYQRRNVDLFNQLYRRLKWVRQRIRDIERTR